LNDMEPAGARDFGKLDHKHPKVIRITMPAWKRCEAYWVQFADQPQSRGESVMPSMNASTGPGQPHQLNLMISVRQMDSVDLAPGQCMKLDSSAFVADAELVEALSKRATPIVCDGDRVLFRQGDHPVGLYILQKGHALLSMTAPGGEPILQFETGPGSLLGLPGVVSDQAFTLTAIARGGAEVSFISRDQFKAFMQTFPLMAFKILQVLAAEVSAARRAIVPER
jgi:hypothetical protein